MEIVADMRGRDMIGGPKVDRNENLPVTEMAIEVNYSESVRPVTF
jgi:hypothetical protein